ncbi:hypothetical protein ABB37_05660 [Leptomonas pyrrhocoris]|uniref:Uncharacterized protein n=1 Tax=Leptomonas pyrrhocoris TaxID=157538 RepID=A0A0M9FZN1_LEPPY|nr:hypothetical protein ABB37_05660 [Leptomonas pyrrhocoris]XP_015657595.1 hypothetical protein ABB37_05660 [Leptomonas pyrrhocoris]KPA79155.1 hypothetical protein ABB37_05660 [Leptomonas pyrrhocoris]KPA79156.1 hypothetical protein ABB37_05660 [Leptomonas pyrrhocoris]|eukprot:XP_015657594.1 hypothetical protein ABB37_05660 [Leptomonas pyrrhocoris]
MTETVAKAGFLETPFSPHPHSANGARLSSGSLISTGTGAAKPSVAAPASRKPAHSASFVSAAGDADPYALLCSNPAHAPPSLAQRTHGTEALFQYYAQRGYKELLMESNSADASKAVQMCLAGKADSNVEAAALSAGGPMAEKHLSGKRRQPQPKHIQAIDRCLAAPPTGTPAPLRLPRAQDKHSSYLSQQADEERAQAQAQRRAHLHQPPTESAYVGRFYPAGVDVLPHVNALRLTGSTKKATNTSANGSPVARSPSPVLSQSASLVGATARGPAPPLSPSGGVWSSGSAKLEVTAPPDGTPTTAAPPCTPEEVVAQTTQQRDGLHLLVQQIDEAFVAAYRLRHPDAARRQRERESAAAARLSSQAAAQLLADGPKKRKSTAAKRGDSAKKKRKSTALATATPAAVEGSFPANLSLFRSSLLLLSNEDGAVTLDQLCTMAADVPFNVPVVSVVGGGAAAVASGSAVQRLFRVLNANTRAPNAVDAADLLLAVASAATAGGLPGRQPGVPSDNSASHAPASISGGGGGTAAARASNSNATTGSNKGRTLGTSVVSGGAAASGGSISGTHRNSTQSFARGIGTPTSAVPHPQPSSVSFASNAHSSKIHPAGASGAWKDAASPVGFPGKQQNASPPELKDSRKCVLVLELLDALDALLNSAETKQIVRWECFMVLAAEGHGYIHKSQLVFLRRHAYRDGSVSEASAAVTASMVRALEDAFSVVAAEEEAAFLKANRKGRKGAAARASVGAHQKSAIPLHLMRKSHMDFELFCRFFDALPQMSAAFAHVWLPLLISGARRPLTPSTVSEEEEEGGPLSGGKTTAVEDAVLGDGEAGRRKGAEGLDSVQDASFPKMSGGGAEAVARSLSKPISAPGVGGEDDEGFPLELLGDTPSVRQAAIQRMLTKRLEQLQEACDALEKEKLQAEAAAAATEAFGSPEIAATP